MRIEIGDHNAQEFLDEIDRCGYARGLAKRDYQANPSGSYANVPTFPSGLLITDPNEQQRLLSEQQANRSSLYDIRMANYDTLKSLDQGSHPLCWAFSSTKAAMYARILMGEPGLILSPWYVAGKIKGWRDEGGWGAQSSEFIASQGVPTMDRCASYRSSAVSSDAPQNALLHKDVLFFEGTDDPDQNTQIMISAYLRGWQVVKDYNWLSHSMCGCRLVSLNPLVVDCDNSWNAIDQYGEKGLYRITGNRARPSNIVVVATTTPSQT